MDNKKKVIISILLIAIIIILLLFCRFGKIHNYDNLIPTGNVDVFDIDIFCNHKVSENNTNENDNDNDNETNDNIISENENVINEKNSNKINAKKSNRGIQKENESTTEEEFIHTDRNGQIIPVYNEQTDNNTLGKVFVDDNDGNYLYQERLNIFSNAAFKFKNKIAPGVSNVYHFVVHNSNNMDVKYYLQMYEESEYQINLKYRLKCGEEYAIGNDKTWVSANELVTNFKNLNKGISDNYSLEWKWFDDDNNDTAAGKNMDSEYKLNIRFFIEAVNS